MIPSVFRALQPLGGRLARAMHQMPRVAVMSDAPENGGLTGDMPYTPPTDAAGDGQQPSVGVTGVSDGQGMGLSALRPLTWPIEDPPSELPEVTAEDLIRWTTPNAALDLPPRLRSFYSWLANRNKQTSVRDGFLNASLSGVTPDEVHQQQVDQQLAALRASEQQTAAAADVAPDGTQVGSNGQVLGGLMGDDPQTAAATIAHQTRDMSDDEFEQLRRRFEQHLNSQPQVPVEERKPLFNTPQALLTIAAALLDPRHAGQTIGSAFQGLDQARKEAFAQQLAQHHMQYAGWKDAGQQILDRIEQLRRTRDAGLDRESRERIASGMWDTRMDIAGLNANTRMDIAELNANARRELEEIKGGNRSRDNLIKLALNGNSSPELRQAANEQLKAQYSVDLDIGTGLTPKEQAQVEAANLSRQRALTEDQVRELKKSQLQARTDQIRASTKLTKERAAYVAKMTQWLPYEKQAKIAQTWEQVQNMQSMVANRTFMQGLATNKLQFQNAWKSATLGSMDIKAAMWDLHTKNMELSKQIGDMETELVKLPPDNDDFKGQRQQIEAKIADLREQMKVNSTHWNELRADGQGIVDKMNQQLRSVPGYDRLEATRQALEDLAAQHIAARPDQKDSILQSLRQKLAQLELP